MAISELFEDQVQADELVEPIFLGLFLFSKAVHIQAHLVKMGCGFRDRGDGHDRDADDCRDQKSPTKGWESNMGKNEPVCGGNGSKDFRVG
jgi:hypothetical protein